MWKSVLSGIILENMETLKHYQAITGDKSNVLQNILGFVTNVIKNFPWYFYLPVRILSIIIGLICLITTGRNLNSLSSEKRSSFLRGVQFIPFFGMLNKLVRSMTFLKLFDDLPLSENC